CSRSSRAPRCAGTDSVTSSRQLTTSSLSRPGGLSWIASAESGSTVMFEAAYPGKQFAEMNFAYASNAIAGFLLDQLAFNDSPWDRFLAGNDEAMTPTQLAGAKDFLTARCSICHNGPAFTDNKFHNVAVAQLGPGEGDGPSGRDD